MNAFALRAALMRSDLTLGAKVVGVVILDAQGRVDGTCKLSRRSLAEACGLSVSGVRSALRALSMGGWIAVTDSTHNRAWRRLQMPPKGDAVTTPLPEQGGMWGQPHRREAF